MTLKIDIKSLVLGLVIGIIALLAIGAASRGNSAGKYQVSIAANVRDVFYAKIHTGTGEIMKAKKCWILAIVSLIAIIGSVIYANEAEKIEKLLARH